MEEEQEEERDEEKERGYEAQMKKKRTLAVYLRLIKITWFRERTLLQNGRFRTRNRVSPLRWPSE